MTNISLAVSPAGIGYSMTNDNLNLLSVKDHGTRKKTIGVRIFGEAQTAQSRRLARSARRNNQRTKKRIMFLNKELKNDLDKTDPDFLKRVYASQEKGVTLYLDRQKFPTIYHLEKYLVITNQKADIRLIYLALHSLLSHRGHFYDTTPLNQFKQGSIDLAISLSTLNNLFGQNIFDLNNVAKAQHILLDDSLKKQDKNKQMRKLLLGDKTIVKECLNAVLGYKSKFNLILDLQSDDPSKYSFKLSDADLDDKLNELKLISNPIINELQKMFSAISLQSILNGYDNLLDAKIAGYDKHKQDLALLKQYAQTLPQKASEILLAGYTLYVNNRRRNLKQCRQILKLSSAKSFSHDDLLTLIKRFAKNDNSELGKEIFDKANQEDFLLKQRNSFNAFIPYQINALIFNKILKNQGRFYPVLVKPNPALKDFPQAPYYLSQVMQFTLPYWAGVMNPNSKFAWAVHKEKGAVNCFNFYQKIDVIKTADNFIKRMVGKDTYLYDQYVLPNNSLLYQEYKVLNELSNIRVNDHKLAGAFKMKLLNDLFKKHKVVTAKMAIKKLNEYGIKCSQIHGLSDPKKFSNNLSSYIDYAKYFDLDKDKDYEKVDQIIEFVNVFSDKHILKLKLEQDFNLTKDQLSFVLKQIPSGWGNLSKMLLSDLTDSNGESVIDHLRWTSLNFMQIINQPDFKEKISQHSLKAIKNRDLETVLADAYASPSVKRSIRQAVKVLKELVEIGGEPDKIMLTNYRSEEFNRELKLNQVTQLKRSLGKLPKNDVKFLLDDLKKFKMLSTKQYLYFQQLGTDVLTGEKLDFHNLAQTRIMHIIPNEIYNDDSNENIILTSVSNNDRRVFTYGTLSHNGQMLKDFWYDLVTKRMFSKSKYYNMITDTRNLTSYQIDHYLNRQLVETNHIAKLLAQAVQALYPKTQVLQVRDSLLRGVRYRYNFYKIKALNDYWRAFDAYLANVVGEYLYRTYPVMRKRFIYGVYLKPNEDQEKKIFNPLWRLLYSKDDQLKNTKNAVVFSKNDLLDKLISVYNYKYIPVSTRTENHEHGKLFGATVYPNSAHDLAKSRKLIPRKEGMNPAIYGGYIGQLGAYMALVRIYDRKGAYKNHLINIPIRKLQNTKEAIADEVKENFKSAVKYEIIWDHIPFNSLIVDGKVKMNLTSHAYSYNARQLILPFDDQQTIMDYIVDRDGELHFKKNTKDADMRLIQVYNDLLKQMHDYLPFFKRNRIEEKLLKKRKAFTKLTTKEKASVIKKMLDVLHANPSIATIDELGLSIFSFSTPNQVLSDHAKLIMQSATGLHTIKKEIKSDK